MPEQVGHQGIDVNRIFVLRSAGKTQYLGSRGISLSAVWVGALAENGAKQAAVRAGTSTCHRFEKFKYGAQGKGTAVLRFFPDHVHRNLYRNFTVQLHGCLEIAQGLDGLSQMHLAAIDGVPLLFESGGDVVRRHRAE